MKKKIDNTGTKVLLDQIILAAQDKKANNIVSINLTKIENSITNYFVICSANSNTQADSIYDNIIDMVQENLNIKPTNKEGYENSEWILIDYFDIVVHIFISGVREFYKLEELWADGILKKYKDVE